MTGPVASGDMIVVLAEDRAVGGDEHGAERLVACLQRDHDNYWTAER